MSDRCEAIWQGAGKNNKHLPREVCGSERPRWTVRFKCFFGKVELSVCSYHLSGVKKELKAAHIEFDFTDVNPPKPKEPTVKKVRFGRWCSCGDYIFGWDEAVKFPPLVENFIAGHQGEGHVRCSPRECEAARRRRIRAEWRRTR